MGDSNPADLSHGKRQNEWLLPNLIDWRAEYEPDVAWTEFPISPSTYSQGFRAVTYKIFANAINGAAHWIEKAFGGKSEQHDVVAYIGPNDIRYYIFLLGAVKAGYVALFISPRNSAAAQQNLLRMTKSKFVVSTFVDSAEVEEFVADVGLKVVHGPPMEDWLDNDFPPYPFNKTYDDAKKEPLVLLHTSGSTGLPKPIVYTHQFASRFANVMAHTPPSGFLSNNALFMGNRLFAMLPPFHAGGVVIALFTAVFFKTTIVSPLSSVPVTARGLVEALRINKFDVAFGSPVTCLELDKEPELLDELASHVEYLFYAGGDLPMEIGNHISKRLKFFQVFGYTENGTSLLMRKEGPWPRDDWKYVCFNPQMGAEFRHLHDDLYQHWIVRKPELEHAQPTFSLFPDQSEYTSRDLFSPHPTKPDLWTHRGRADDIIVFLNGEKTNPTTFEQTMTEDPSVSAALVIGAQRSQAALLIETRSPLISTHEKAQMIERLWERVEAANRDCPHHAKVSRSHILFTDSHKPMSRAGKGTVQREATLAMYQNEIQRLYKDAEDQPVTPFAIPVASIDRESLFRRIKQHVLQVTGWKFLQGDEAFFAHGMDSLQVLQLIRDIKFSFRLPKLGPSIVYTNQTINSLTDALIRISETYKDDEDDTEQSQFALIERSYEKHITAMSSLFSDFVTSEQVGTIHTARGRTVLLTGSTGGLGSFVLQTLSLNNSISHVYCLNRASKSQELQIKRNAERGLLPPSESNVSWLTADLSQSNFGLSTEIFKELSESVTDIIHTAWPVNFNLSLESFDPQLTGILKLAHFSATSAQKPQVFFVSSVSSLQGALHDDSQTSEAVAEEVLESPSAAGPTGYAASKHVAEKLLAYASLHYGVSASLIRVGQIAGPAEVGAATAWGRQEWFPSLMASSTYLKTLPSSLASPTEDSDPDLDWVPVDVLAQVLMELAGLSSTTDGEVSGSNGDVVSGFEPATSGKLKVFHPLNPHQIAWKQLLPAVQEAMSIHLGAPISIIPLPDWIKLLRASGDAASGATKKNNGSRTTLEKLVEVNPAFKLLEYFEDSLTRPRAKRGIATQEAEAASETLRNLGPISTDLLRGWMQGWGLA